VVSARRTRLGRGCSGTRYESRNSQKKSSRRKCRSMCQMMKSSRAARPAGFPEKGWPPEAAYRIAYQMGLMPSMRRLALASICASGGIVRSVPR